eukprot:11228855-Ditylum_brightwellii.AAC.1
MRIWTERTTVGKMKWNREVHCCHGEQFKSWWRYRSGDNFAQQTNETPELFAGNSYTMVYVRIDNQEKSTSNVQIAIAIHAPVIIVATVMI